MDLLTILWGIFGSICWGDFWGDFYTFGEGKFFGRFCGCFYLDTFQSRYFFKAEIYLGQITDNITVKDIGLITAFGLIIPSVDQGSDYYTAATLIRYGLDHSCKSSPTGCSDISHYGLPIADHDLRVRRYGYAMLAPIIFMTIFTIRQWWRLEKGWNRLWTLPLVLFQCFPQYRALRILYLGLQKKASWRKEKDLYDQDLTSLGIYLSKCFDLCSSFK